MLQNLTSYKIFEYTILFLKTLGLMKLRKVLVDETASAKAAIQKISADQKNNQTADSNNPSSMNSFKKHENLQNDAANLHTNASARQNLENFKMLSDKLAAFQHGAFRGQRDRNVDVDVDDGLLAERLARLNLNLQNLNRSTGGNNLKGDISSDPSQLYVDVPPNAFLHLHSDFEEVALVEEKIGEQNFELYFFFRYKIFEFEILFRVQKFQI